MTVVFVSKEASECAISQGSGKELMSMMSALAGRHSTSGCNETGDEELQIMIRDGRQGGMGMQRLDLLGSKVYNF